MVYRYRPTIGRTAQIGKPDYVDDHNYTVPSSIVKLAESYLKKGAFSTGETINIYKEKYSSKNIYINSIKK